MEANDAGRIEGTGYDPPNPSDVLSLFMYFKTVRIALQTNPTAVNTVKSVVTAVDGAVDSGLLDAFDKNDVQLVFYTLSRATSWATSFH